MYVLYLSPLRCHGLDLTLCVQWQTSDLMSTTSCLGPWTTCSIPVPKEAGAAADEFQLDFVVKGPNGAVDKPQHANAYHLESPGGYKISKGDIRPFPQASLAPFMLVCSRVRLPAVCSESLWCCVDDTAQICTCGARYSAAVDVSSSSVKACIANLLSTYTARSA